MRRDKPSSEQSGPTTRNGRQIAYDREIFIAILQEIPPGGGSTDDLCQAPDAPQLLLREGDCQWLRQMRRQQKR